MTHLSTLIADLEGAIEKELGSYMAKGDLVGASHYCFNQIIDLGKAPNTSSTSFNLQRYFYAIQMLHLHIEGKHLKANEVDQIIKIAETSLQRAGIKDTSQVSYLFEEIYSCRSKLLHQSNRPLAAQWQLLIGKKFASHQSAWVSSAIGETMAAFQMGYVADAKTSFEKLMELQIDREQLVFLELQLIKAARLSGQITDAELWISRLKRDRELSRRTADIIHWESMWCRLARSSDLSEFAPLLSKQREFPEEPYLSVLILLAYAHSSGSILIKQLPSSATIRKRFARRHSEWDRLLLEALELFPALYDQEIPLRQRLNQVADILDRIQMLHIEHQLLFFLALARWATRSKQYGFSQLAINRYKQLSTVASKQKTDDVLAMAGDIATGGSILGDWGERAERLGPSDRMALIGPMKRRLKQWMTYSKVGWQLIATDRSARDKAANLINAVTQSFIEQSVAVTGPHAKSMQILSQAGVALLGVDSKLSEQLAQIYRTIPLTEAVDVEAVFYRDCNKHLSDVFASWDTLPFSGGSISQVFRATLKDGTAVALKMKSDKVEELARHDFARLKAWAVPVARRFSKVFNKALIDVHEMTFLRELDFKLEVANMQKFAEIFRDDQKIVVPRPIPEYCSANIITMEYVEGMSLESFCNEGSQGEKEEAARTVLRFFLVAAYGHNLFKTDLFEGNLRFSDGKVAFIDYGRVLSALPSRFEKQAAAVWQSIFDPANLRLPIPDDLMVAEDAIHFMFHKYILSHHHTTEPMPIFAEVNSFVEDLSEIAMRVISEIGEINLAEFQENVAWGWIVLLMTRLGVRLRWVDECKAIYLQNQALHQSRNSAGF